MAKNLGKWLLGGGIIGGALLLWSNRASASSMSAASPAVAVPPLPAPPIDMPPMLITLPSPKKKPAAKPAAKKKSEVQNIDSAQAQAALDQMWGLVQGKPTRADLQQALTYAQAANDPRAAEIEALLKKGG